MDDAETRTSRTAKARNRCVFWLSSQCHGGTCDCANRVDKEIREEAEQRRVQLGASSRIRPPTQQKPNDSKEA